MYRFFRNNIKNYAIYFRNMHSEIKMEEREKVRAIMPSNTHLEK